MPGLSEVAALVSVFSLGQLGTASFLLLQAAHIGIWAGAKVSPLVEQR